MEDQNTDNKNSSDQKKNSKNKKFRWISILFILFLLLFIGSAGYYLESDLQPINEDGLNDSQEGSVGQISEGDDEGSLLDRVINLFNSDETELSSDLKIIFVGLDDKDSVSLGEVEADSIMLAELKPAQNKLVIENINENTEYNSKELRKYNNTELQKAVSEIKETQFDHYVYLHYQGFEKVIDQLGGVQINLAESLKVPDLGLNLKAGENLLSGKEALNYVRWNELNNNSRLERQKKLINAVIAKIRSNNILFNVRDLYNTVVNTYNSIETDIDTVEAVKLFNYFKGNKDIIIEFEN